MGGKSMFIRKKNLADIVAIYGRGRELFRPPTYQQVLNLAYGLPEDGTNVPKHVLVLVVVAVAAAVVVVVVVVVVKTLLLNVLVTCALS
jgi:hypothetical protein